jgi:hypothetical protein
MEYNKVKFVCCVNEETFLQIMGFHLYRGCYTDWAILNAQCESITSVNFMSTAVSTVCASYQMLLPFNRFNCNCTESENQKDVPLQRPLQARKGEIIRDLEDGWCRTGLRLTVRTVGLKLLTGPFRLGNLLYLQTDIRLYCKWQLL